MNFEWTLIAERGGQGEISYISAGHRSKVAKSGPAKCSMYNHRWKTDPNDILSYF